MKKLIKSYDLKAITDLTADIEPIGFRQMLVIADGASVKVEGEGFERTFATAKDDIVEVNVVGAPAKVKVTGGAFALLTDREDLTEISGQSDLYAKENTAPRKDFVK